ncbi:MAG: MFS transporter [Anaerolineales bacterium]|nr:MFS transporter [Anaerolineales bacterium]
MTTQIDEKEPNENKSEEKKFGLGDLFKIRDYRLLFSGQIISNLGDGMTSLAILLLVNHLTGSTTALATMAILLALPSLTFGLAAGVIVDRVDRKRMMIISDLLRGVFVLGFIFVDSAENIWILYVIGFIQASIATFFTPARGALIPNIVPPEGLMSANSLSQTSRIVVSLIGTGIAGFLIGHFEGYWEVFLIDAITFFLSLGLIAKVHYSHVPGDNKETINLTNMFRDLGTGLKLTFSNRVLTGAIIAFAMTMLGLGAVNILLVPLLVNDLLVPETWFAAIEFSQTSAMVLAGGFMAILASRFKVTNILAISLIGLGAAVALMSLPTAVWHIMAILFLVGLMITPVQAAGSTIIQTVVPDEVRGRTGSANNALITTAQLVSMGAAGFLADIFGARNVFNMGGGLVALAGVAALFLFWGVELKPMDIPETPVVQ